MITSITHARRVLSPVVRELPADVETPVSVYLKLRGLGPSFLLESVEGGEHLARYSIIGSHPRGTIKAWRDRVIIEEEGRWTELPPAAMCWMSCASICRPMPAPPSRTCRASPAALWAT
jgi:anthranilate/para-aminobenzoate synthase component I